MTTETPTAVEPIVTATLHELDTLRYHLSVIYTERYKGSMTARAVMPIVTIDIAPGNLSATDPDGRPDWSIWDQVTIDGHGCGNRHGGARAYCRLFAGDPDWFRP